MNAWADRPCGILLFFEERGGHDNVCIHSPERHAQAIGSHLAPSLGISHRILVADYQTRLNLSAKPVQLVVRPPAQHKSDILLTQPLTNIAEPLDEKCVTAQVGIGIERNQAEECHNRLAQNIRRLDGHIERGVIQSALRALHPVDNAPPFDVGWTCLPHPHTRVFSQFFEVSHYAP